MRQLMILLALAVPAQLAAQDTFEATYVVQQAGKEIGRERVVLRAGQPSSRAGGRIELDGKYAGAAETVRGVVTRGPDGLVDALQLEVRRSSGTETIRAATRGNRVFITTSAQGSRGGRELPGSAATVLLDEQLLTLLVIVPELATPEGARLSAIYPRTGKRSSFTAKRVDGPRGVVIELTGELGGRIQLDPQGRMEKIDLDTGVSASRLPS